MCSLLSVTDKSVKSLSSVKESNLQTLFGSSKFHEPKCARVSAYDLFLIIFCGYERKCYCFIRSFCVRNYSEEQRKLPCRWLRPWVNRDDDTVASYFWAIRVLSVELRNWIDRDEEHYHWRRCKHHHQHPIRTRESNICILVLMTACNDAVFAPVSSRSCYLGNEFHNTECLATVNSPAVVLRSWDMTRVTQVEHTVNTRRILLWEIALESKDL